MEIRGSNPRGPIHGGSMVEALKQKQNKDMEEPKQIDDVQELLQDLRNRLDEMDKTIREIEQISYSSQAKNVQHEKKASITDKLLGKIKINMRMVVKAIEKARNNLKAFLGTGMAQATVGEIEKRNKMLEQYVNLAE